MTPTMTPPATLDDLMKVDGKAELIGGRIIHLMPSGRIPNRVAGRIYSSLLGHADARGSGEAYTDNMGFKLVPPLPSGRQSFSPDASFDFGPYPSNGMKFNDRSPAFAVEVRSENDYTPSKYREYEDKRRDYFIAGTQVVWDVDPLAETIAKYSAANPNTPIVFRRGDTADAEPALPGWHLKVDDIFA